jgi:hypothetical protein
MGRTLMVTLGLPRRPITVNLKDAIVSSTDVHFNISGKGSLLGLLLGGQVGVRLHLINPAQHFYFPKSVDSLLYIIPGKLWHPILMKCRPLLYPSFSKLLARSYVLNQETI